MVSFGSAMIAPRMEPIRRNRGDERSPSCCEIPQDGVARAAVVFAAVVMRGPINVGAGLPRDILGKNVLIAA